jgi:hypothetical protein
MRHARRLIIVDGIAYTWKYGNYIEIRRGSDVVLRRAITDVLGVSWDDLERAQHKGYGYPVTPARVAELIRKTRATISASICPRKATKSCRPAIRARTRPRSG